MLRWSAVYHVGWVVLVAGIQVNRAPFLTLWASVVARRLGYDEPESLTLGKAVAGQTAAAKGKRLGIYSARSPDEKGEIERKRDSLGAETIEFMDRRIACVRTQDGLRSLADARPVDPESVRRYLRSKFKEHLPTVEQLLTRLASTFEPNQLEREAMDLYMTLRPAVPAGSQGWGKPGILDLDGIDRLTEQRFSRR
jgi:hypothetical protein